MGVDAFQAAAQPKAKSYRKPSTLSVRLTHDERERLDQLAGDRPVSAFVRSRLFGKGGARASNLRRATPDNAALAQVLAALGRSDLSADLNTFLWAADNGQLQLDPDSLCKIRQACVDIAQMRRDLVSALKLNAR